MDAETSPGTTGRRSDADAGRLVLVTNTNSLATVRVVRSLVLGGGVAGAIDPAQWQRLEGIGTVERRGNIAITDVAAPDCAGLACVTSGSTGTPKVILRHYDTWLRSFALQRRVIGYDARAGVHVVGNLAHSMHLYAAMEALDRDIEPTIERDFAPRRVLASLREARSELLYATPAHLVMLVAAARSGPPVTTLTHILTGGAKFDEARSAALKRLFPAATVVEFFGTTETSFITIKEAGAPPGSLGRPCPGVEVRITDGEGRPRAADQEGEIWIRSDMLFDRYLIGDDPHTRWRDGWLTVGDRGYLDAGGYLYFTARDGAMVTIAGENVYLDHVEARLRRHVTDAEVAVIAVGDPMRGHRLVAAVEASPTTVDPEAILRDLRGAFGALTAPKHIVEIGTWPRTASGKTDRRALAETVAGTHGA